MPNPHDTAHNDSLTNPAALHVKEASFAALHDDTRSPAYRDVPHKQVGTPTSDPTFWDKAGRYLPDVELIYDRVSDYLTLEYRTKLAVELIGQGDRSLTEKELRELKDIIQEATNDGSVNQLIKGINEQLKANGSTAEISTSNTRSGRRIEPDRSGKWVTVDSYPVAISMEGGRNQVFEVERKS